MVLDFNKPTIYDKKKRKMNVFHLSSGNVCRLLLLNIAFDNYWSKLGILLFHLKFDEPVLCCQGTIQ